MSHSPAPPRSPRTRRQRISDIAIPLLIGLLLVASALEEPHLTTDGRSYGGLVTLLGMCAGAAQAVTLWWRRSHPVVVMAVAVVGGLLTLYLAPKGLFPYAGLVALGSLAAARPPRISLAGLAALLAVTSLGFFSSATPAEDVQFAMAMPVVAWALGETVRNRRSAIEQEMRRAVSEEQARIARELHDVLAHSVSVIVIQAAAADDVFEERPDQARASLRAIESSGRTALGELRRLLAAVRPGAEESEARHPQPGLGRLEELATAMGAAGLRVTVRHEHAGGGEGPGGSGGAEDSSGAGHSSGAEDSGGAGVGEAAGGAHAAGVELSAYRIVQEALTNTLRHAAATHAEVTVRTTPGALEIAVRDNGRESDRDRPGSRVADWSRGTGGGYGIAGMRERAAMLGGTLEAGPHPGGGFLVEARLPWEVER